MGKEKPLVSVIIPVYNTQDYLKACIESVQNQTYPNLEILLVDDGSTDQSGALCEEYAAQNERIRVFHKENGGLSDARNMGLMEAHGEFLAFVDSDDLLAPKAVETLETLCETSNAEAAIGQVSAFAGHCTFAEESVQGEVIPMKEAMRRMLLHQKIGHEAWGKLYRRSLWQAMKFPVGLLYEDYAAIYRVIAQCRNVAIAPIPLYYYRVRSGSIMHSGIQRKNLELLEVSADVTAFIEQELPELRKEAAYLQLVTYLKLLKGIMDGGFYNYPMEQEKILAYVQDQQDLIRQPWAKRADKIKVKTLLLSKHLFYWVYELAERKNARDLRV